MSRDALIVGINKYQKLPELTAAGKDAEGIASLLETHGDFRVRRLPEIIQDQRPQIGQQSFVSTQQLENSLVRLLLPKGEHIPEVAFFYFSGHGLQREIGIREGYLATSDTQPESSNSGLSLSWLRRLIRHSPVRQIIIILDCCHSGEFLCLKDETWQGADGHSYLFIAASREYEEAYESLNSDYSVLTQAIISGLLPQNKHSGRVTTADLVASITNRLSNEIQQPLFEQGGSEIVITRQGEHPLPKSDSLSIISRLKQYSFNFCPYRGPHPFEEKHTDYFFGREELIQSILTSLQQHNLCTLIGASGSGKTSLLRAGIIPRISAGHEISGSEYWLVRYMTPGAQPLRTLASVFTIANQAVDIAKQLWQAEQLLRQDCSALVNLVTAALLKQPGATKFWLVIDQFEELLAPTPDPHIQQDRNLVIGALVKALHCPSIPLGIIISLRADAIDHLINYNDLFSLVENHQIVIPPMKYQAIRDVIEKPAEKLGLKLDPYLVHNLTLDLTGAPGELALLQSTLYELWQYRTPMAHSTGTPCLLLDSYIKLGRLPQIITNRATELYQSLPSDEQAAAKRIFLSLCELGEGHLDKCRQAHKSELINQQFPRDLIERTLKKLVKARLIVLDKPQLASQTQGKKIADVAWKTSHHKKAKHTSVMAQLPTALMVSEDTVELAHQSLISDWSLLRQWLQANRKTLRHQRDIEARAWIWHQRGETQCSDYLLGQQYLKDVSQFLTHDSQKLSILAQRFMRLSQRTVTYQRWRARGIAVLFPLAIITGMTLSLVRQQLTPTWRVNMVPTTWVKAQLPTRWGILGTKHLAIASQILTFKRQHSHIPLQELSIHQLVDLMTPDVMIVNSASLPDGAGSWVNDGDVSKP